MPFSVFLSPLSMEEGKAIFVGAGFQPASSAFILDADVPADPGDHSLIQPSLARV